MKDPRTATTRLLEIMATLRSEHGCPWDRAQTPESLKPYLIEETFEVLEAIEEQDPVAICEELGDLLLQVVFQAQIFAERGDFDFDDVAEHIGAKLLRRHPHVFADDSHGGEKRHQERWEEIKLEEQKAKGRHTSVLGGVPRALPALQRCEKVIEKAARAGVIWPDRAAAFSRVQQSMTQLRAATAGSAGEGQEEAMGDLVFDLSVLAYACQNTLEPSVQRAIDRVQRAIELRASDLTVAGELPAAEILARWRASSRPE